jgi:hypothetical protein
MSDGVLEQYTHSPDWLGEVQRSPSAAGNAGHPCSLDAPMHSQIVASHPGRHVQQLATVASRAWTVTVVAQVSFKVGQDSDWRANPPSEHCASPPLPFSPPSGDSSEPVPELHAPKDMRLAEPMAVRNRAVIFRMQEAAASMVPLPFDRPARHFRTSPCRAEPYSSVSWLPAIQGRRRHAGVAL